MTDFISLSKILSKYKFPEKKHIIQSHIEPIIKADVKAQCKELFNTFLSVRYLDIKRLPIAISKHIISFINYGDTLYKFIQNYPGIIMYCITGTFKYEDVIYKKSYPYIFETYDRIISDWAINEIIEKTLKHNHGFMQRYINIIIDNAFSKVELASLPLSYFCSYDNNDLRKLDDILYHGYHSIVKNSIIQAIISYDYNLLLHLTKITSPFVYCSLFEDWNYTQSDYWKIISLIHMNDEYYGNNFIKKLCQDKNITLLKYLIKNDIYNRAGIHAVVDVFVEYGWYELLDYVGINYFDNYIKRFGQSSYNYVVKRIMLKAISKSNYEAFNWFYYHFDADDDMLSDIITKLDNYDTIRQALYVVEILANRYGKYANIEPACGNYMSAYPPSEDIYDMDDMYPFPPWKIRNFSEDEMTRYIFDKYEYLI